MSNRPREGVAIDPEEVYALLPETIIQVDDGMRILHVNRSDSPIFRTPPIAGGLLVNSFDADASGLLQGAVDSARHSGLGEAEYHAGDSHYKMTARRLKSAPVTVIVFEDVTSRRHTERALMEMMRGKSNVLASVGTELQAPLSAVIAYATLLAQPDSEFDETYRGALVEHMAGQAWDLAGIVDDLLAMAHTEIGDLRVAEVPVNLFANTAQVLESMGDRGTRITVTGDPSITAVGDPGRLRQIVRNLLSNALTHGAEPITIDVSSGGNRALLRVKDRGPGVSAEIEAEGLFSRSVGSHAAEGRDRVGLGLWISRELAELMKGHLDYRREYGLSVFEVGLPLRGEGPGDSRS